MKRKKEAATEGGVVVREECKGCGLIMQGSKAGKEWNIALRRKERRIKKKKKT